MRIEKPLNSSTCEIFSIYSDKGGKELLGSSFDRYGCETCSLWCLLDLGEFVCSFLSCFRGTKQIRDEVSIDPS